MNAVQVGILIALLVVAALLYKVYQQQSAARTPAAAVEVKVNPHDGQPYVWVPPGSFRMGCSPGDSQCDEDEYPPHTVTITNGFWMGQTEVTVGAYRRFAQATGRPTPVGPQSGGRELNPHWSEALQPVVNVTWKSAVAYCQWAGGRLPTEAEWEYAARAGSTAARHGDVNEIAWYADNSGKQRIDSAKVLQEAFKNYAGHPNYIDRLVANENGPHRVGQKLPNALKLYDVLGNVLEWVADWYGEKYYAASESRDPRGPSGGDRHVARGSSWLSVPRVVRASVRDWFEPYHSGDATGFRCVREVIP